MLSISISMLTFSTFKDPQAEIQTGLLLDIGPRASVFLSWPRQNGGGGQG